MDCEFMPDGVCASDGLLTDIGCYQVSYLREIRGGGVSSGYVATGFWGGEYRQCKKSLSGCPTCSSDFGGNRIDCWSSHLRATQQEGERFTRRDIDVRVPDNQFY